MCHIPSSGCERLQFSVTSCLLLFKVTFDFFTFPLCPCSTNHSHRKHKLVKYRLVARLLSLPSIYPMSIFFLIVSKNFQLSLTLFLVESINFFLIVSHAILSIQLLQIFLSSAGLSIICYHRRLDTSVQPLFSLFLMTYSDRLNIFLSF